MTLQFPPPTTKSSTQHASTPLPQTPPVTPMPRSEPSQRVRPAWLTWAAAMAVALCVGGMLLMGVPSRPPNAARRPASAPLLEMHAHRSVIPDRGALVHSHETEADGLPEADTPLDEPAEPTDPDDVLAEDRSLNEQSGNEIQQCPVARSPQPPRASTDPEPRAPDDPGDFELRDER